jgi:glycosyltransferase involved in cell wall biosynthesis
LPPTFPAPTIGYLASQYPAVSHTFILREIEQLRRLGFEIRTASVKPPAPSPDGFTEAESREAAATFCVKTRGAAGVLGDHLACFLQRPGAYLAGLLRALRMGGADLKAVVHHLAYFGQAIVLGEWMGRERLGHLHVHLANAASTAAMLMERTFGIPYSMTVHGPDEFYDTGFYHVREKVEHAAFICCISRFCRSQLMRACSPEHWDKMEVCPLGVDPEVFQPRREPGGDAFRILCVGRLTPAKGQAILLAAVAILAGKGRRVHADLVGDGPDRHGLEAHAARLRLGANTTFHGAVNQPRVLELLARADVFVLPSFAEGVPVSLMEAMAMEVPCVSTTIAGIPELIHSGEDGILVPPSDPERLAGALEELIENAELRLRLARAGRRKVMEQYNLSTNVRRLAEIFKRRLEIHPRGLGATGGQ